MERADGFGFGVWGLAEGIAVASRAQAAAAPGPRRGVNGVALVAARDFALGPDADAEAGEGVEAVPETGLAAAILILTERRLVAGFGCNESEKQQLQKRRCNASVRLA